MTVIVAIEINGERTVLSGRDAQLFSELARCLDKIRATEAGRWSVVWNGEHVHKPRIEETL